MDVDILPNYVNSLCHIFFSLFYPCVNRLFRPIYTIVCLCFCKMKRKENILMKRERWPYQEGGRYCENEWWEISGLGEACLDLKKSDIFFHFLFLELKTLHLNLSSCLLSTHHPTIHPTRICICGVTIKLRMHSDIWTFLD